MDQEYELINLKKCFRFRNEIMGDKFYDPDLIHLNKHGAERLAKKIFDCTTTLPTKFFE